MHTIELPVVLIIGVSCESRREKERLRERNRESMGERDRFKVKEREMRQGWRAEESCRSPST